MNSWAAAVIFVVKCKHTSSVLVATLPNSRGAFYLDYSVDGGHWKWGYLVAQTSVEGHLAKSLKILNAYTIRLSNFTFWNFP